jgi:hypothetical protein
MPIASSGCQPTRELSEWTSAGYATSGPMKNRYLPLVRISSFLLAAACGSAVAEEKPKIVLSPELALNAPDVPDEKNGIVLFENQIKPLENKTAASLSASLDNLRVGTPVDDPALFKLLEKRHATARAILKAPARFPKRTEFEVTAVYGQIFQGAEALACRSMLDGNRPAAAAFHRDMLEWSRLMRNSHPALIEYVIGFSGWVTAFNGMLRDWESHPDQKARLAEIEGLYREFPCSRAELIPVFRRESQFWCDSGGTLGFLKQLPPDQSSALQLDEPFSELTPGELLKLPYDEAVEIRRFERNLLDTIDAIHRGTPLNNWPAARIDPAGKTLDVYHARPNGLGDLLYDYSAKELKAQALSMILFAEPSMETCLGWLKAENNRKGFTGESRGVGADPWTGKALKIEPESRRIRSVGPDMELENLGDDALLPGIFTSNDDLLLQVPSWRKDGE